MSHKNVIRVSDVGVLVDGRGIREFTEDELSPDGNNQYVIMFMKEIRKIFPTIKFAGDVFNPRDFTGYQSRNRSRRSCDGASAGGLQ